MKIQFLLSTMNRVNFDFLYSIFPGSLVNNVNVIIINQCTEIRIYENVKNFNSNIIMYSVYDKGLSKSRNLALSYADADICVLTDDDYTFIPNVIEVITKAYSEIPDADVITFQSLSKEDNKPRKNYRYKVYKHKFYEFSSISSSEITFKLSSILKASSKFDERFGLGTSNLCGEEGIFLIDSYKKKLNIYHYPSFTLFEPSYTTGHKILKLPYIRGKIYRRMYKNIFLVFIFIIITSLINYRNYKQSYSLFRYIFEMLKGCLNYEK